MTGAIFTTTADGSTVDQNIYLSTAAVYLTGGPDKSGSGLPDGNYYFQVTNPSGNVLLSTDAITEREVTIANGIITQYLGSTHATGTDPVTGAITVQLIPYDNTPNPGGEYKAWMTPVEAYDPSTGTFGFVENDSRPTTSRCSPPARRS